MNQLHELNIICSYPFLIGLFRFPSFTGYVSFMSFHITFCSSERCEQFCVYVYGTFPLTFYGNLRTPYLPNKLLLLYFQWNNCNCRVVSFFPFSRTKRTKTTTFLAKRRASSYSAKNSRDMEGSGIADKKAWATWHCKHLILSSWRRSNVKGSDHASPIQRKAGR